MFKLLALLLITTPALTLRRIEDNTGYIDFLGSYRLIHIWPRSIERFQIIPNCSIVEFTKPTYNNRRPFTCTCDRPKPPDFSFINLHTKSTNTTETKLLEVAKDDIEEINKLLEDHVCMCHPDLKFKEIVLALTEDDKCILYFEKQNGERIINLLCKTDGDSGDPIDPVEIIKAVSDEDDGVNDRGLRVCPHEKGEHTSYLDQIVRIPTFDSQWIPQKYDRNPMGRK